MKKLLTLIALIALLPLLTGCNTIFESENLPVAPGRLVKERMLLPAQFKDANGSFYIAHLDAIVIRPDDDQAHPLAVINHGYDPIEFHSLVAESFQMPAMEFARRGWVTILFSRRGYGRSEGRFVEGVRSLNRSAFVAAGQIPVEDIREVIRLMQKKSYVDGSRVISAGVSGGGYASIALTVNPPPGLVAAINFAGGMGTRWEELVVHSNSSLVAATASFGKSSRIPMLWVYAENDHVATLAMGRQMYTAFTEAGGNAEFIAAPSFSFKNEGHYLFKYGSSSWAPYVDVFLEKQGLKLMDGLISVSNMRTINYKE